MLSITKREVMEMSVNLHFSFSVNGSEFLSFRHDFFQTTTLETYYVLDGCPRADPEDWYGEPPPEVTSLDPQWEGALSRLREITKNRILEVMHYEESEGDDYQESVKFYQESVKFLDDLERSSKAPGVVVKIYGM